MNKVTIGCLSVVVAFVALFVAAAAGAVPGILLFVAGVCVLVVVARAGRMAGYAGLAANGIPALGILLEVASTATSLQGGQIKVRRILVDVEVPGQPPFETRVSAMMPANLSADVIPGATMELRVHPKNSSKLAIVGPGVGFAAAALLGPPSRARSGTS